MKIVFRVPHTLVLLFFIMVLAWLLTLVLPAGSYLLVQNEVGREVVVADSFELAEQSDWLPPSVLLTSVPRGMAEAQDVIFFVLLIGGVIALLRASGAIEAAIGQVLQRFRDRVGSLMLAGMLLFGVFSATFGMAEEYLAFVGILVAFCAALKLDAVAAVGIMVVGYGIGYGCAIINPFTVVIAQQIAELKTGSGWGFRLAITIPFFLVGYHHVYSYSSRIRRDPSKSLIDGWGNSEIQQEAIDQQYPTITIAHLIILISMAVLIGLLFYGVMALGWYLVELSALFLGFGILVAIVAGLPLDMIGKTFVEGASELTGTALLIGFARAITVILDDGGVMHTIVYGLASTLDRLPAEASVVGMLGIQHLLNFFIPSGTGQAYVTMPIMAPVGDVVGVSRQVSVLAYQFGDGFTNMIVPTNPVLMGILGLAGVSYGQWFRFIFPLILKFFLLAAMILIIAVRIQLQ